MSMNGRLRQLTPAALDAICADPQLLDVIEPRAKLEQDLPMLRSIYARFGKEEQFLAALARRPDAFDGLPDELDIGKAWQAIHFLLTGDPWDTSRPCGNAVLGGTEIGEDGGYGPKRVLLPAEVAVVDAELDGVSAGDFEERFALLPDSDIYPSGWGSYPDELEWVLGQFRSLRAYYANAAARGHAMLLGIV